MKSAGVPMVFIIDDDRSMRQAIQDLVESVGLRAEAFATGQDFLRKQPTSDPSCLVLDVRLPQMSGLDLQRQKSTEATSCRRWRLILWRSWSAWQTSSNSLPVRHVHMCGHSI